MVGEPLALIHTKLILTRTPDSIPLAINEVVANRAEMVDRLVKERGLTYSKPWSVSIEHDLRVPIRVTRGPIEFSLPEHKLPPKEAAWYNSPEFSLNSSTRFELVNFVDGQRTISEIQNALSAEFGPVETQVVSRYLEDLVQVGVMRWK